MDITEPEIIIPAIDLFKGHDDLTIFRGGESVWVGIQVSLDVCSDDRHIGSFLTQNKRIWHQIMSGSKGF